MGDVETHGKALDWHSSCITSALHFSRLSSAQMFAHDRIKESAYALLPKGDAQKSRHLNIGRDLCRFIDEKTTTGLDTQVEDGLFLLAARHMNLGSELLENGDEKVELARLNNQAGEMAFYRSSPLPNTYKLDFLY
jgi:hypothetical protein